MGQTSLCVSELQWVFWQVISISCSYLFILVWGHKHKHLGLQFYTFSSRVSAKEKSCFKQQEGQRIFWAKKEIPSGFKTNRTKWSMQTSFLFFWVVCLFFSVKINNQWVWKGHGKSLTFGNIILFWLGGSIEVGWDVSRFLLTLVVVWGTSGRKQRIF